MVYRKTSLTYQKQHSKYTLTLSLQLKYAAILYRGFKYTQQLQFNTLIQPSLNVHCCMVQRILAP